MNKVHNFSQTSGDNELAFTEQQETERSRVMSCKILTVKMTYCNMTNSSFQAGQHFKKEDID